MDLTNLLNNRTTAIRTYDDEFIKNESNNISEMDSDQAESIINQLTKLKNDAIAAAKAYSEELDKTTASYNDKFEARDLLRHLSPAGGRRRRSSTPRKSSSSRRRRSTKRRTASRKQQKRRRGSRRAH